jgi:hypothetical protein
MLLLARVDGKSPVEYLTPLKQQLIRDFVYKYLPFPPENLARMNGIWSRDMLNSKTVLAQV